MEYIGLLDCNNFFVSCERLFRPDLQKRPTLVLSSNDGCVVARSPEIKAMGIPMGVPYFKIKKELEGQQTAVFSSNFTLYRDISSRVMFALKDLVDEVDQYSIDEAFFRLSGTPEEIKKELDLIKQTVEKRVGVPVSVGAARTKTIAKVANHLAKRQQTPCLLAGSDWIDIQSKTNLTEVWGIGSQTSAKMRQYGLVSVADLLQTPRWQIGQLFGVEGVRKFDELNEVSVYKLNEPAKETQQSIISSRSFAKSTSQLTVVSNAINYHVTEAARELRTKALVATALEVHIAPSRHSDWFLHSGRLGCVLTKPTNDTRVLLKEALTLLKQLWEPGVPYRKAGVMLSMLKTTEVDQPDLFVVKYSAETELSTLVDKLNERFGRQTLTFGRLSGQSGWQSNRNSLSPRYTTNWSEIAVVKS